MRLLNAEETRRALPMADAIDAMEHAFTAETEAPLRSLVANSLVMPGRVEDVMAVKVVSIVPGNPVGLVVVFGPEGSPLGLVDGTTLTSIRTGAVAGLATKLLSPSNASTMAMLGAGAMAFDQIEAVRTVRQIDRVLIWSRSLDNAQRLAQRVGGEALADPNEAVAAADIVSCATPARSPLFSRDAVQADCHVNAVGAFTPEMVELPPELVRNSFVVVDDVDAAAAEAGDLIQADKAADATLRALLDGSSSPDVGATTVFKSVGVAAQDVSAGQAALMNAAELGLGQTFDL